MSLFRDSATEATTMGKQAQPASTHHWLDHTLRQFDIFTSLRERKHVRRTCKDALKLYRAVAAEMPEASSRERYERVVARRTGADPAGVARILRRAEESFASWPSEHPLRFRHVAEYLAITEQLNAEPGGHGLRTRVDVVVARLIPADI
jgi:hypothetical protein